MVIHASFNSLSNRKFHMMQLNLLFDYYELEIKKIDKITDRKVLWKCYCFLRTSMSLELMTIYSE